MERTTNGDERPMAAKDDRSISWNPHDLAEVAILAALTAALAFVSIPLPFSPAPLSGQTFGVMLAGLLLPPGRAAMSQAVYVSLGAIGLPVFAGGASGIGVLLGPTGGYLWGFIAGAFTTALVVGMPSTRRLACRASFLALAAAIGGIVVVYALGIVQMTLVTRLSLARAALVGAAPFIPGDLLKALAAGLVGRRLRASR